MSFGEHLRRISSAVVTLSLALGIVLSVTALAASGVRFGFDLELDTGDSPWILLDAPLGTLVLSPLLSPLSYLLDWRLFRRRDSRTP